MLGGIRLAAWHLIFGLHSDIPVCCVWQFIRQPTRSVHDVPGVDGYIPCDRCYREIMAGCQAPVQPHCCEVRAGLSCRLISPMWRLYCRACGGWIDPQDPARYCDTANWCRPCATRAGVLRPIETPVAVIR